MVQERGGTEKIFTNFTKFIKNLKEILNTEELKNLYKKKILFDKI